MTNVACPAYSGPMLAGVPITTCDRVRSDESRFASPKSGTFGRKATVNHRQRSVRKSRASCL